MDPKSVSDRLRKIAAVAEGPSPSKATVALELQTIIASLDDTVTIQVTENPERVTVTFQGKTSSANWADEERLKNVKGDEHILRAAMSAWNGEVGPFTMTADQLAELGGGHWAPPTSSA